MKKLLFALLYHVGVVRAARWWNRRRVMILCYHGVTERTERSPQDPAGLHVRRARFERQLDYLKQHYNVISLREYLAARRAGRTLPAYTAVLTFDDGYRNFLTAAAPRLAERTLPATVFLITDRVRANDSSNLSREWSAPDDESFLSWEETRALRENEQVEFGSHTCSHPKLTTLAPAQAEREMRDSYAALRTHIDDEPTPFAYPYGDYSDALAERARALGYTCALTTDDGANDAGAQLFALKRTLVGDHDDEPAFAARVSGLVSWLRRGSDYPGVEVRPSSTSV